MQPPQQAEDPGSRSVRDGDGRQLIADVQRARLLTAAVQAAAALGAGNVTVSEIVERAGVSRRTFYELFADLEECVRTTFDDALARAAGRVLPAYRAHERWRDRVRAALEELLAFLDEDAAIAKLLIVESMAGGRAAVERRAQAVERIGKALHADGSLAAGNKGHLSFLTGEVVVGGILAVLHARVYEPRPPALSALASQLTSMAVLPYLGVAAAQKELSRPAPEALVTPAQADSSDPFKGLRMRLTYRTLTVLEAIAAHPGCSNREAADASGIKDQGQISKLLRRLERFELIVNDAAEQRLLLANSWKLTARGTRLLATVEERAGGSRNGRHESASPSARR